MEIIPLGPGFGAELRGTTVADVFMGVLRDVPRPALELGARWIGDAAR